MWMLCLLRGTLPPQITSILSVPLPILAASRLSAQRRLALQWPRRFSITDQIRCRTLRARRATEAANRWRWRDHADNRVPLDDENPRTGSGIVMARDGCVLASKAAIPSTVRLLPSARVPAHLDRSAFRSSYSL